MSELRDCKVVKVAIIGTANRNKKLLRNMSAELYEDMIERAHETIVNDLNLDVSNVILVSGGAAWSDHVAVSLFERNRYAGLELYIPCDWKESKYYDNGERGWRRNPGYSANMYHRQFSDIVLCDTLAEIENAQKNGAVLHVKNGFHARNTCIAKSDTLIAFTWANNEYEITGGSRDTWRKCNNRKIHISLNELVKARRRPSTLVS